MSNPLRFFLKSPESFPSELSAEQRYHGQRLFRRFLKLNGVTVAFLMENMLVLYAIKNGVSDGLVASIASFIHLTMPFMIVGKLLVARIGLGGTWGLGWFLRYASACLMVLAPFAAAPSLDILRTGLILAGAFGFALFRSMGAVANTPLMGEITSEDERGRFISGNFVRINGTHLIAMGIVIFVLRSADHLWVYQLVLGSACLVGFYASTVVVRIPESRNPAQSAQVRLTESFKKLWATPRVKKLLFAWCAGFVSFVIVIPFGMITVKNGYGVSDHSALFFSLLLVTGSIASSLVNGVISDRVGPRPLLILYSGALLLVAGFWAAAPEQFYPGAVAAAFFLSGVCKAGIIVGLGHYFLSVVDYSDRISSALFMRVLAGAAAGLAGSMVGGSLLELLHASGADAMTVYRTYFRIMLVALVGLFIVIGRLDKLNEWKIRNILGLLFSPRDMRALYVLNNLRRRSSDREDARQVQRLGSLGSQLSEDELREFLDSPKLSLRVRALQALRNIPFGAETEEAILAELKRGEYTSAWIAAEIAGERGVRSAIPLLRKALDSEDHFLQGKAMVALVRLEDEESHPAVVELFRSSDNPRIVIHGANALSQMGGAGNMRHILEKSLDDTLPEPVTDEVLIAAASMAGQGETFYQFLKTYNKDSEAGVTDLLPQLDGDAASVDRRHLQRELRDSSKPLRYFRQVLSQLAEQGDDAYSETVNRFLHAHEEEALPRKAAFCLATILSANRPGRHPSYMVD